MLAVGARASGHRATADLHFSADQGLTFYAPGCGLDQADPSTDQPTCCGNGTSQASAFAAAVLVALMSYDPTLTYAKAEQLLVSHRHRRRPRRAAAFKADGLGAIVTAGNANIPKPAPAPPTTTRPKPSASGLVVGLRPLARRRADILSGLGRHARLSVQLDYQRASRHLTTRSARIRIRTTKPRLVFLRVLIGDHEIGKPITVHLR